MAITSKGYTGSLNNVDWSVLADKLGAQFAVFGPDSFRVAVTTGDRALSVRAGEATGQGIRDVSDSAVTLTGAPVASGDRWDMVSLRRTWSTKTTTLVLVQGSSAKALPSTRKTVVGDVVDHPLYLVRFTAGQTAAQELIDLRVWYGDGGLFANSLLVRDFLDRIGTTITIVDEVWKRVLGATGLASWRCVSAPPQGDWIEAITGGGLAQANAITHLIAFVNPRTISAGALLHIHADAEIWIPPGGSFAGFLQILRGNGTVLAQRRWHSQGRTGRFTYPSVELNLAVTEEIPAGTQFRFSMTSDPLSSGAVEVWHAFASWGVS